MSEARVPALGIDLGGTTIKCAVFDPDGRRMGPLVRTPTESDRPGEHTLRNLYRAADEAIAGARANGHGGPLAGVGVGSTGPLDPKAARLLEADSLPNLRFYPLGDELRARFGLPVRMTNDTNAFTVAEARFGAARGARIVLGVTIGTGCGMGLVLDGRIYEGATANAGEVYRVPLRGKSFDQVISGSGLARLHEERTGQRLEGRILAKLAAEGDEPARETLALFGTLVGEGLGVLAAVVDPELIVLGGSVAESLPLFRSTLESRLAQCVAPRVADSIRIVPSTLGASAGALGAACLFFEAHRTPEPR